MVLLGQVLVDVVGAEVRRRGEPDPADRALVRRPGDVPDREPERQPPEQAPAVRRRGGRRRGDVHRHHLAAGARDRRLRGADRDDRRLLPAGAVPLHQGPAQQAARTIPYRADRHGARAGARDRRHQPADPRVQPLARARRRRSCSAWSGSPCWCRCARSRKQHWKPLDAHDPLVPARDPGELPPAPRPAQPRPGDPRRPAAGGRRPAAARAPGARARAARACSWSGRCARSASAAGSRSASRPSTTPRWPSSCSSEASTAVRNASMRRLLDAGAESERPARDGGPRRHPRPGPGRGLGGQARQQAAARPPRQAPPRRRRSCASARARRQRWRRRLSAGVRPSSVESPASSSSARRITIRSGSTVTSTGRWPAQCSRVDRVVGDRRVEPEAVALVAVVEARLHRRRRRARHRVRGRRRRLRRRRRRRALAGVARRSDPSSSSSPSSTVWPRVVIGLVVRELLLARRGLDLGLDLVAQVGLARSPRRR